MPDFEIVNVHVFQGENNTWYLSYEYGNSRKIISVEEIHAAEQKRALDKVPVRLGDPCSRCGGCDVQCAECLAALCQ